MLSKFRLNTTNVAPERALPSIPSLVELQLQRILGCTSLGGSSTSHSYYQ